jgi:hypothetical protein
MPHLIDKESGLCTICQRLNFAAYKEGKKYKRLYYDVRKFSLDEITDPSDPIYRRVCNHHYIKRNDWKNIVGFNSLSYDKSSRWKNHITEKDENLIISDRLALRRTFSYYEQNSSQAGNLKQVKGVNIVSNLNETKLIDAQNTHKYESDREKLRKVIGGLNRFVSFRYF